MLQLEKAYVQKKKEKQNKGSAQPKKKKKDIESSGLTKRSIKMPVSNHTPAKFMCRIHSLIAAKRERTQHNEDLAWPKINFKDF